MLRCRACGETNIDQLEPMDNGATFCATCRVVTRPEERKPPAPEPRQRRDLDD